MSYLNQNYFNNFQVRNPILKNPINYNAPLQLVKARAADASVGTTVSPTGTQAANGFFTTEDLSQGVLRICPTGASTITYTLPSANSLIDLLGVQSNGLPTPTYSNSVQKGDVLVLPVISRSSTGATIYAGTGGTGCVTITGPNAANCSVTGRLGQLVIEFTNVSSGALGVTGSYVVYGGQISN
jgi:hypothetical protein